MSNSARRTSVESILGTLLRERSGFDLSTINRQASFLELGFDSLFLIQLSQEMKTRFQVKISFRQLIEDVPTVDALIDFLAREAKNLPDASAVLTSSVPVVISNAIQPTSPDPLPVTRGSSCQETSLLQPAALSPATSSPSIIRTVGSSSVLEQIILQQNQLMSQHLQLLVDSRRSGGSPTVMQPVLMKTEPTALAAGSDKSTNQCIRPEASAFGSQVLPEQAKSPAPSAKVVERFGPYKPIRKAAAQGLTEQQAKHLDAFIARYTKRTAKSREHAQTYREHFADPRGVAGYRRIWKSMVYQIVVEQSKGSKLRDLDGNEYIDIAMGFGLNLFGQSPDFIVEAIQRQLTRGVEVGPQSPLTGEVAQLLCAFARKDRATFCNTGSEAVMAALRLARTVTGKSKIVFFNKDYHGNFEEVLVRSNLVGDQRRSSPAAPGVPQAFADNAIVLDYGTAEALQVIEDRADEIAAVLIEPVQSADPFNQPREFLQDIRRITRDRGIAMVMDEVITGFRAAQGGAQEWYGVWGDMATYGKILGGGLPIGALAGTAEYMDALDGGNWRYEDNSEPTADMTFFAGTFVRHPLAMAAAHQVLLRIKEEGPELQQRLTAKTTYLVETLNRFFESELFPIRVAQFTSLFRFMFPSDLEYADMLYFHLLDRGIFTRGWGDNCFLSTAHSDDDIERIIQAVQDSCLEIRRSGFFPEPDGTPVRAQASLLPVTLAVPTRGLGDVSLNEKKKPSLRLPLTESQLEVWLSSQMGDQATCAFNQPFSVRFSGELHQGRLIEAIQRVVARHEAFRFRFDAEGRYQEAIDPEPIDAVIQDLSQLSDAERAAAIARTEYEFAATPFDLQRGPLVRFKLLRLAADEFILAIASHHIVNDGWSWGVLLGEFGETYSSLVRGDTVNLSPAGQYTKYVLSTQNAAYESETTDALQYWLNLYASLPEPLDLPTDRPRPILKTFAGGTVLHQFNQSVYVAAKQTAAAQGVSFITMIYAALNVLLSKLSGQQDLVITVPQAGQSVLGEPNLVGHLINLLPVRSTIDNNKPFSQFLNETKSCWLDALDHGQCTLGQIIRELRMPRESSRMPLVEVNFNFDPEIAGAKFEGLRTQVNEIDKQAVNFDLFFNFSEADSGLRLFIDFNRDIFDSGTISRWAAHFENLLSAIIENPHQPIAQLRLLSEQDADLLLSNWNATQRDDFSLDVPVHMLFERQVEKTPDAEAIVFGKTRLTYQQLNQQANRLSHFLTQSGVRPGNLVGVYLERSQQVVISVLAILKAGGTYVPLDPRFPENRLAMMAEDAELSRIVTQSSLAKRPLVTGTEMICLDAMDQQLNQCSIENPLVTCHQEQGVYVIYTSGSTGKPKGVQIPHRALTNFLLSMQEKPGLNAGDTLAAITTLSFDISGLEVFLPLIVGAKLIMVGHDDSIDGRRLADLLDQHEVTVMQATPATWRLLIETGWRGRPKMKVLCGGEPLTHDLAGGLLKRCGELWNMYGPTETTIWSTIEQVTPDRTHLLTIGRPIANTEIYILDAQLHPVPIGVTGRLYIGGDGLALGYLNRPKLNGEKFIAHPFRERANSEGAKIYDTGDQARYLADGRIEFLGRLDGQVKIRGYRIELGEIEHALLQHPEVSQAIVIARAENELGGQASDRDQILVGYLVAEDHQPPLSELRDFLRRSLPEYMVPKFFMFLDELPLTANRKVDRKALPIPQIETKQATNQGDRAPRGTLELQLANIWKSILGIKQIGVQQNFFDLGGHSLSAARMMFDVERVLGHRIPLATLLQAPTIEQFANVVQQRSWETTWQSLVLLREGGSALPLFCIHAAGGNVLLYRDLAKRLSTDRPIYGIQSASLDGTSPAATTVEEMAREYIAEIRKLQPHGPYHLCGYCLGGTIAFEIAQQLRRDGEEVGLLALFDTHSRWFGESPLALAYRTYQQVAFHVGNVFISGPRGIGAFLTEKLSESCRRGSRRLAVWASRIAYRLRLREKQPLAMLESFYDQATEEYTPQPYEGRMSVFKPKKAYLGYEDAFLGWRDLVENITVIELPVYPAGMLLEPFVAELSEHLNRQLALADSLSDMIDDDRSKKKAFM